MKIRYEYAEKESLAAFAERHDLTMVVRERTDPALTRFFACFEYVEIAHGGMLISTYGDGATEEIAIANYATRISRKMIVVEKPGRARETITCPELTYINEESKG